MSTRSSFFTLWLTLASIGTATAQLRFREVSGQGFGDRYNTKAWSMAWWQGHLFVGTARAHVCLSRAGYASVFEFALYPPRDAELGCTEDEHDLPLQAEIWRYRPEQGSWDLVFRSPLIPNPAAPEKTTARDAGFRDLIGFTESDGTEALYAFGITSESIHPGMPPPRILRTTDGEAWEPVPQEPSTFLGELGRGRASFRAAVSDAGRLFVVNGDLLGAGTVLESEDPASGGDAFRAVTPVDMSVFELTTYRSALFVGVVGSNGYRVLQTSAQGAVPYAFTSVIEDGGYARGRRARGPTSMYVYRDRLYVGTDSPGELVRVNPDGSWDLIVGRPRSTPDGWKEPLSGLGPGFDYGWANHLHRLVEHDGLLYVSLNDAAAVTLGGGARQTERVGRLQSFAGFDLFSSDDGTDFSVTTLTGFGDPRENVIRVFASTRHGLFAGTANPWRGLRVYVGEKDQRALPGTPRNLSAEKVRGGYVYALTWEPVSNAVHYRVYRRRVRESPFFEEVGSTADTSYLDVPPSRSTYHYYVRAESSNGESSRPSNLARIPSLRRRVTLSRIESTLGSWSGGRGIVFDSKLAEARRRLRAGEIGAARKSLESLKRSVRDRGALPAWRASDAANLVGRMLLRLRLAEVGMISTEELDPSRGTALSAR